MTMTTLEMQNVTAKWNGSLGTGKEIETYSWCQRASIDPASTYAGHVNTLIAALKTGGVWAKLDAFYLLAGPDSFSTRQNLVTSHYPLILDASQRVPAFAANAGWTGDGSLAYLQTKFNPSTAGGNWAQNSACMFVRELSNRAAAAASLCGQSQGRISSFDASNNVSIRINAAGSTNYANGATSNGFYMGNRTGAAATRVKRNGTLLGTDTTASAALQNTNFRVLSNTSSFTAGTLGSLGWGSSLSTGEEAALEAAELAYMQAIGAV